MPQQSVDLESIFQAVAKNLDQNQRSLDQLDTVNHDHGTNMAQTFRTISTAVAKKKGSSASSALAYAGKQLAKTATSSSGKMYAENLSRAASQFKGKTVTERGALDLLSTLIGSQTGTGTTANSHPTASSQPAGGGDLLGALLGGMGGQTQQQTPSAGGDLLGALLGGMTGGETTQQPPSAGGDLLGALLGGMTGGETTQQPPSAGGDLLSALLGGMGGQTQQQAPSAGGDLLGALLGGMTGGQTTSQQGGGFGLDDLLQAAMAYMQAKQQGQGNLMAIIQAIAASSRMGTSAPHRNQSTQLVVGSFLQALSGMKQ